MTDRTAADLLAERRENLDKIQAAIRDIEERTILRANGQWSETHNNFLTVQSDDPTKALAASAVADGGFAMQDHYMLMTLLAIRREVYGR